MKLQFCLATFVLAGAIAPSVALAGAPVTTIFSQTVEPIAPTPDVPAKAAPDPPPLIVATPGPVKSTLTKPATWIVPKERMEWSIRVRDTEGARARLAVGPQTKVKGRQIVAISADAKTVGLIDKLKHVLEQSSSVIDMASTLPVVSELRGEEGKKRVYAKVSRDSSGRAKVIREKEGVRGEEQVALPPGTHDPISSLGILRHLASQPLGTTHTFVVYSGLKTWSVTATTGARESQTTALGELEIVRVEGSAIRSDLSGTPLPGRSAKLFSGDFTADNRRIPVRFATDSDYGPVTLVLTTYGDPKTTK